MTAKDEMLSVVMPRRSLSEAKAPSQFSIKPFPSIRARLNSKLVSQRVPVLPLDDEQFCQHCKCSSAANSQQTTTMTDHIASTVHESDRSTSPRISLEEALRMTPNHDTSTPLVTNLEHPSTTSREPMAFLKDPLSLIPRSLWKARHAQPPVPPAPPRPSRPPQEQCPSYQPFFEYSRAQVFPDLPQLNSTPPIPPGIKDIPHSYIDGLTVQVPILAHTSDDRTADPVLINIHHDLAYKRLTGNLDIVGQDLKTPDTEPDNRLAADDQDRLSQLSISTARLDDKIETSNPGIGANDFQGSFSTLPSTVSKLALKPSPLRPKLNSKDSDVPPIPIRSPLRNIKRDTEGGNLETSIDASSDAPIGPPHRPSYDTMSVYSIDSNGVNILPTLTPPSSPPGHLQSCRNRSSSVLLDPRACAEEIRSELGIIDDIYDMYTDAGKHDEHEVFISELQGQMTSPPTPSRTNTDKLSRAQRRLRKERARRDAFNKLEEPKIDIDIPESNFSHWLDDALSQATVNDRSEPENLDIREHDVLSTVDVEQESHQVEDLKCRISAVNEEQVPTIPGYSTSVVPNSSKSPDHGRNASAPKEFVLPIYGFNRTSYVPEVEPHTHRPSLALLQDRLFALMDTKGQPLPAPASPTPSNTTGTTEYGGPNLQRIDIEWRGKKYPVLIGDEAKIFEAPCMDPYCKHHGGPRKELAYGKF